jgi:hypothetical protein
LISFHKHLTISIYTGYQKYAPFDPALEWHRRHSIKQFSIIGFASGFVNQWFRSDPNPKFEWERFVTAIKIDRIPLFDVRRWTFISFFFDLTGRSFGRRLG